MTLWLHIGVPKAGSSTLQHFLEINRERLHGRGIHVPQSASRLSHRRLKIYALDDEVMDNLKRAKSYDTPRRIAHFRATFRERLKAEVAAWPATDQVVLTCEQLVDVKTPSGIGRLAELLHQLGHEIRVLLYVRRQDQLLPSLYVQRVRGGITTPFRQYLAAAAEVLPRYEEIPPAWAAHFGRAAIHVRPIERSQLKGGSIVDDAMALIGLQDLSGLAVPADRNLSLSAAATEFLRHLNPHVPRWIKDGQNMTRKTIIAAIEAMSSGEPIRLSEAEARLVLEHFAEGNARLAREWMGREDGILFQDPIEARPPVTPGLSLEEFAAQAAALAVRLAQPPER